MFGAREEVKDGAILLDSADFTKYILKKQIGFISEFSHQNKSRVLIVWNERKRNFLDLHTNHAIKLPSFRYKMDKNDTVNHVFKFWFSINKTLTG